MTCSPEYICSYLSLRGDGVQPDRSLNYVMKPIGNPLSGFNALKALLNCDLSPPGHILVLKVPKNLYRYFVSRFGRISICVLKSNLMQKTKCVLQLTSYFCQYCVCRWVNVDRWQNIHWKKFYQQEPYIYEPGSTRVDDRYTSKII